MERNTYREKERKGEEKGKEKTTLQKGREVKRENGSVSISFIPPCSVFSWKQKEVVLFCALHYIGYTYIIFSCS